MHPMVLQAYVLLLRGGHAEVWAAIMHEIIKMGHDDVVARRTALIIQTGRPNLAGEGMRALARIATPTVVRLSFIVVPPI